MTTTAPTFGDEHAALRVGAAAYEVVAVDGEERVSALFRYDVTVVARAGGPAVAELLGEEARLTLRDAWGSERIVVGVVAEAHARVAEAEDGASLRVVIRPAAFRLTLGRDSRVFHDSGVVDIVQQVLARDGLPARFDLAGDFERRVYTAQYRESDWAFVSRLCEEEGIHYRFEHGAAGAAATSLVFADRSSAAAELPGGARIRFAEARGTTEAAETIDELGAALRVTSNRFSHASFDPGRPRFKVAGDGRAAHGTRDLEVYDAPAGGSTDPGVLSARAQVAAEASVAGGQRVEGRSASVRIAPGRILEVAGHRTARLDGRYFVTGVKTRVVQRRRDGGAVAARPVDVTFDAIRETTPFRAPRVTPSPVRPGLQSGRVVGPASEEIHPDEQARVRVQHHWDREGAWDERAGTWMRVAQRGTAGSMLFPRIGWTVMTMNAEGAPDAPCVLSRVFDAENPPPYALPENMTQTAFKTATTPGGGSFNELRYEDKAGAEEMLLVASRDLNVLVNDAKSEQILANSTRTVGVDHALTVGANEELSVAGNQTVAIGAAEIETVGSARVQSVGGSDDAAVAGSRSLKVGGASQSSVAGARTLSVGAVQIDASLGDIRAATPVLKVLVGGVLVRLTARSITESVGMSIGKSLGGAAAAVGAAAQIPTSVGVSVGGALQTIGGAKLEIAAAALAITAAKAYSELVGGPMFLTATDKFVDVASGESTIETSGGLTVSGTTVNVLAKADGKIEVTSGASKITISDDRILIHAPTVELCGATIDARAPKLEFNV